jgi:hypothetical protein
MVAEKGAWGGHSAISAWLRPHLTHHVTPGPPRARHGDTLRTPVRRAARAG